MLKLVRSTGRAAETMSVDAMDEYQVEAAVMPVCQRHGRIDLPVTTRPHRIANALALGGQPFEKT